MFFLPTSLPVIGLPGSEEQFAVSSPAFRLPGPFRAVFLCLFVPLGATKGTKRSNKLYINDQMKIEQTIVGGRILTIERRI